MCASHTVAGKAMGVKSDAEVDRIASGGNPDDPNDHPNPELETRIRERRENPDANFVDLPSGQTKEEKAFSESRRLSEGAGAGGKDGRGFPAPDPTDKTIQEARKRQMLMAGRGRKSTFLTGPAGVAGPPPALARKTTLGGY